MPKFNFKRVRKLRDANRILNSTLSHQRVVFPAISKLVVKNGEKYFAGTAFSVHPRILVTAAHCLFSKGSGLYKSATLFPGLHLNDQPYGKIFANKFSIPDEFREHYTPAYDFGCIILDRDLILPNYFSWQHSPGANCIIKGYTYENMGNGILWNTQSEFGGFTVLSSGINEVRLENALYSGMSGSPYYSINNGQLLSHGIYVSNDNYSSTVCVNPQIAAFIDNIKNSLV
ncbi:MAG TPA: hypothetical protein VK177_13510 [Flavobacteriales bacterium]|nr:hypothetical protein [Flavobacteriales bacterium]